MLGLAAWATPLIHFFKLMLDNQIYISYFFYREQQYIVVGTIFREVTPLGFRSFLYNDY